MIMWMGCHLAALGLFLWLARCDARPGPIDDG